MGLTPSYDYLRDWHATLSTLYPDYRMDGGGNVFGTSVTLDQRYVLQRMLPAYQGVGIGIDPRGAMDALGIDETRLIDAPNLPASPTTEVVGARSTDFILIAAGETNYRGGMGGDVYYAAKGFGDVVIADVDRGAADELRFTEVTSDKVVATRVGHDLVLTADGPTGKIIVQNHFLGEANPNSFADYVEDTALASIIFADGVVWDKFRIALAVSKPDDTDQIIVGSGDLDIMRGGKGNDVLQGGAGGDIYIFAKVDGQDVVDEQALGILPCKAGLDFIQFTGDVSADDLYLTRFGESGDLIIQIRNKDSSFTGDSITVRNQFDGMRLNLGAFLGAFDPSLAIDYLAPNLIEKFIFEDGSWLDFTAITARVLTNAKTESSDIIYGFIDKDTLDGGTGDDVLIGREGADTFIYGRNYGNDVINDTDFSVKLLGAPDDTLRFTEGLRWSDFDYIRNGASDDLTLRVKGTTDSIELLNQDTAIPMLGKPDAIERLVFADGTIWSQPKLFQHFVDMAATTGGDTIYGFSGGEILDGKTGNDLLQGGGGSDTYIVRRGDGSDIVLDAGGGSDRLIFEGIGSLEVDILRTSVDLIFRIRDTGQTITLQNQYVRDGAQRFAVESLEFTDRIVSFTDLNPEDVDLVGTAVSEVIADSQFRETLDGRAGDDTLVGGSDGDTYLFDAGYGNDTIIDIQERAAWNGRQGREVEADDRIVFGAGLTSTTALWARIGDDLVISFSDRPDTLTIRNQFRKVTGPSPGRRSGIFSSVRRLAKR